MKQFAAHCPISRASGQCSLKYLQGAGQPHGAREGATLQHGPLQREGSAAQKKHVQMEPRAQKPAAGRLPRKIDAPPNIPAVWDVFEVSFVCCAHTLG